MKRVMLAGLAAFATGLSTCVSWFVPRPTKAIAASVMLASLASPLAAETPSDIANTARDLPRSLDLQTDLPIPAPEQVERLNIPDFVFWIVVVIGACVLAYCVYEILPAVGARRAEWDQPGGHGGHGAAGQNGPDAVRAAADELAQQGRFVEAMHVLLLQGLDEMRMRLDLRFADSLTSREVVSRANAPAGAKTALREIIAWVERAYFGDHPVDRNDYDACRRSYVTLDSILRAGGPG